jgi:Na+-transporting NADH:ubiquinone oxidoreductase subunit NqrD
LFLEYTPDMIRFITQLDIITFLVEINGKTVTVCEFENSFAIELHIMEIHLKP